MRIILTILGFVFLLSNGAMSQELIIEGSGTGKLYLIHKVKASEGLYAIGRQYHVDPTVLASYNGISPNKGLSLNQLIKVPLSAANFSQDPKAATASSATPVYYKVKASEGLYRIGINHNKVAIDLIKKWNGLNSDVLNTGQNLIIGYLTGGTGLAANDKPAQTPAEQKPVVASSDTKTTPPPANNTGTEKTTPVNRGTAKAVLEPVKEATKPATETVPNKPPTTPKTNQPVYLPKGTSYFQSAFEDEIKRGRTVKTSTLNGGVFKSTSGWQDGKFYILMNNIPTGTLVKVHHIGSNKVVFAKVLGEVPDMKQNSGLSFRLSNAAAAELGVSEDTRFNVEVTF